MKKSNTNRGRTHERNNNKRSSNRDRPVTVLIRQVNYVFCNKLEHLVHPDVCEKLCQHGKSTYYKSWYKKCKQRGKNDNNTEKRERRGSKKRRKGL